MLGLLLLPSMGLAATAEKVYLHVNKTEIITDDSVKIYGYVTPRKRDVRVRIYQAIGTGEFQYIATKTTKKQGRYKYYAYPEEDTYYRAKIKIGKKWTWGNKKKLVSVDLYPACGENYSWFTQDILDASAYHSISPLGVVNPSGHTFPTDHMYYYYTDYLSVSPVYSPGTMYVESITAQEHLSVDPVFTDYTVRFRPCEDFYNFFMHMSGLSADLEAAYNAVESTSDNCNEYSAGGENFRICTKDVRYKFVAGEIVGTGGGNTGQHALDWGAYDTRTAITGVANQSRWWEQMLNNVCPLDYFPDALKNSLKSLVGYYDERRTVEPICGTINQDVSGTAQGRWFLTGTALTGWQEDHQLALIHEPVDFTQGLFSVGDSVTTLSTGKYEFTPVDSGYVNRDFDQVISDGQVYCYDTDNGVILMQLTADTTLRIESQELGSCGSGPWSFTTNYTDFER